MPRDSENTAVYGQDIWPADYIADLVCPIVHLSCPWITARSELNPRAGRHGRLPASTAARPRHDGAPLHAQHGESGAAGRIAEACVEGHERALAGTLAAPDQSGGKLEGVSGAKRLLLQRSLGQVPNSIGGRHLVPGAR